MKVRGFVAENITTKTLEVGTSKNPSGITLYDRATGEPVCVFSENAVLKSEAGKCGEAPKEMPVIAEAETPEIVADVDPAAPIIETTDTLETNQEINHE